MTHPIFSRIPILGKFVDERFLEHRRRSTSLAGIAGCLVAAGIFEYRLIVQHVVSWDLFAVVSAMAAVKVAMMLWYGLTD
ncbi:MAG: hypothetical protein ABSG60_11065 [Terracidiphilus sp.]|jgi:hypothetical protein